MTAVATARPHFDAGVPRSERILSLLVSPPAELTGSQATFEYLLLGDLRLALTEPPSPELSKWTLALVDTLLAREMRLFSVSEMLGLNGETGNAGRAEQLFQERLSLFNNLRRLRDRLAHAKDYQLVAMELRQDLADLMDT